MQAIEDKYLPFNTNKDNGKKQRTEEALLKAIQESEALEQARAHQLEAEAMQGGGDKEHSSGTNKSNGSTSIPPPMPSNGAKEVTPMLPKDSGVEAPRAASNAK